MKKKVPHADILILERGMFPNGASMRNAGFACFGSVSELLDDLNQRSEDEVFTLVEKRWTGLQLLREIAGEMELDYEELGGYEVFSENDKESFDKCIGKLSFLNKQLKAITGKAKVFEISDHRISEFGLSNIHHMIRNSCEGQLNPGKMIARLIQLASGLGIRMANGASVLSIEDHIDGASVAIQNPAQLKDSEDHIRIQTRKLLICTNGYARQFLPDIDLRPARAQVLLTSPIPNLKIRGSFHYDKGYYYFRNIDGRVLFGGGRNLDPQGETTYAMGLTPLIQNKLEELLSTIILPQTPYEIELRWSGIMGLGNSKSPIIQQTGRNVFCAVRLGGMGIAIGSLAGKEAAELITQAL